MHRPSPPAKGGERRSPTPAAIRKREAIHQLKEALVDARFQLHYQPIVGARDGRMASAEALLRWRSPRHADASLTDLIWAAERSPAIFKLENWTLEQSCAAAASWLEAGVPNVRVNVNLSAREFPRADLVGRLTRRFKAAGLDPFHINIEITETSAISEFTAVADQLERLIAMGIELWLDDFGTGHSSLEWLSHLPLHGLKIPGTFVKRLFTESRSQVIIGRVIDLAHDLGLRVIAEEVETPEQREFLVERGCDLLQGFLLYSPMPAEELPAALAEAQPLTR